MARSGFFAGLLFWFMALAGGLTLAPCLILPAWIEYRAALDAHVVAEKRLRDLQERHTGNERKIEHQRNDVAYLEREARRLFGVSAPGVDSIIVESDESSERQAAQREAESTLAAMRAARQAELLPEASRLFEDVLNRHPLARIFVLDQTRPVVMSMGAALLLAAIFLVGPARRRATRDSDRSTVAEGADGAPTFPRLE